MTLYQIKATLQYPGGLVVRAVKHLKRNNPVNAVIDAAGEWQHADGDRPDILLISATPIA